MKVSEMREVAKQCQDAGIIDGKYFQNNVDVTFYIELRGKPPMSERFFPVLTSEGKVWEKGE